MTVVLLMTLFHDTDWYKNSVTSVTAAGKQDKRMNHYMYRPLGGFSMHRGA